MNATCRVRGLLPSGYRKVITSPYPSCPCIFLKCQNEASLGQLSRQPRLKEKKEPKKKRNPFVFITQLKMIKKKIVEIGVASSEMLLSTRSDLLRF